MRDLRQDRSQSTLTSPVTILVMMEPTRSQYHLPPPVSPQHPTQSMQPVPALAQVASVPTQSAPQPAPQSGPQVFPSSSSSSSSLNIPMPAPFGRRPVSSVQAPRGQAPTTQGSFRQAALRQGPSGPGPPRQAYKGQGIRQAQGNLLSTESSSSGSSSRPSEPWVPWQPSQGGPAYQPPPGPSSGMRLEDGESLVC